ncbi:MAG: hypothetical protein K9J76_07275 [Polaromonas sp.]|nr:hypothetical protein [Polaromonas sp.]
MIMRIEHIDAIARKTKRDVIYVEFHDRPKDVQRDMATMAIQDALDWEHLPARRKIIEWLDASGIGWRPCAEPANLSCMQAYRGQLYIDLQFDKSSPAFQLLEVVFETHDGHPRIPGVWFLYYSQEQSMANAFHDAPGFWEHWAETF